MASNNPSATPLDVRLLVEDIASKAIESSPLSDPNLRLLRASVVQAIEEIDRKLKKEKEIVRKLGGLYVIGTAR